MSIVLTHDPLDKLYVMSYFGMRGGRMHKGVDFGWWGDSWENIDIYAAAAGEVVFAGNSGDGYGYYAIIQHNGFCTLYAHMQDNRVSAGQAVGAGQSIGKMGQSGNASGAHLHFEIRQGSYANYFSTNPLDPMNYVPVAQKAPASGDYVMYTVQSGDTLSAIGARYGVSVASLVENNGISNPNLIYPGQMLKIVRISAPPDEQAPSPSPPSSGDMPLEIGDMVRITGAYASSAYSFSADNTAAVGWERLILEIYEDTNYPYRVGSAGATTGYFRKEALIRLFV